MFSVRVKKELGSRLDAEFYSPDALQAINRIRSVGEVSTLGDEITEGYRVVYHGTDSVANLPDSMKLGFLSPTQISNEGEINFDSVDELPIYYKDQYPKGLAKSGELLIEVKGNVSKVTVVPSEFPQNLMISGSLYKATLSDKVDSHYALAFLKSKHGQLLKNRLTSNTIINYIGKDDLYSIPLLLVSSYAQKYIGDKVRQAERLRSWAKRVEEEVNDFHLQLIPDQSKLDFSRKTRFVSQARMTDRFDAHFYPGVVEDYLSAKGCVFKQLSELSVSVFNGQTQDETQGPTAVDQITVAHLSKVYIKGQPRCVNKPGSNEKFTQKHDLLICNAAHNKSYIGRDVTYYHADRPVLPSTEVMVIRLDREQLPASFVRTYLLTRLGFVQIQSTIRGITAHSYPIDMKKLDIPVPVVSDALKHEWLACDDRMASAGEACEIASKLTSAAKLLVEALIEGAVTEQQLIDAQKAIEAGDTSLDQEILARLTTKGLDDDGEPLFSDLDQLYELLAQSQSLDE